jgi:hypothetical protein
MRGGFLDSLSNSISSGWNSVSQGASSMWDKTKNAASSAYSSTTTPTPPSTIPPVAPTPMPPSAVNGGKRRTRKMSGGYSSNISLTGLAATASPISGVKTAQPHHWVGGRTKRRQSKSHRRHHSKSRRHRK